MEAYNMQVISKPMPYPPMDIEKRQEILPKRNVCSLYPAEIFLDALFTGNGRQQINILGDPFNEYISVSHELLYAPRWALAPNPPDYNAIMPEARRLLREGKFGEAADLVDKEQRRQGFDKMLTTLTDDTVMPPGSLRKHYAYRMQIRQNMDGSPEHYLRYTDLMSGECTVRWDMAQGLWSRKSLVSFAEDVVVQEFTAPKSGILNMELTVIPPGSEDNRTGLLSDYYNSSLKNSDMQFTVSDDMLTIALGYNPEYGNMGNISAIRLVRFGGKTQQTAHGVKIIDADRLLILSKTVRYDTDYDAKIAADLEAALRTLPVQYNGYLSGNREYLGGRMGLSQIQMSDGNDWALSSEELMRQQHTCKEFSTALLEKLYDMGRFYQIIDTGELPPSYGQHNINTNLQVCAGNMTGLNREMDVYFRFYETKFEDFRTNAKKLFGARGLLASIHCDYNSGLFYHSSKTFPHFCWTGCLGWIYNEFWGHYLVTGDMDFLRDRIIPALKEIALFFEDYACDMDESGQSIFYPSFSPENPSGVYAPPDCYPMSVNSVMDIMICREVLDNLIEGCTELGIEQESISHWKAQRAKLPKYLLDEEGGLKEWAWPAVKENYNHRHVSHHYDVWPGHVITWEDTPELAEAVLISNRKRALQNDSAHGVVHRLFTAIRLKDTGDAVHNLRHLMEHGYVTRSLNTSHNPYFTRAFPDLQGAMPAILAEMAVYSAPGVVELLPAMPNSLSRGSIDGIWLYTFAKLEHMNWDIGNRTIEGTLTAFRDQELTLRYRHGNAQFYVEGKKIHSEENGIKLRIAKDASVSFSLKLL